MRIAQLVGGVVLLIIAALAICKMRALASSAAGAGRNADGACCGRERGWASWRR